MFFKPLPSPTPKSTCVQFSRHRKISKISFFYSTSQLFHVRGLQQKSPTLTDTSNYHLEENKIKPMPARPFIKTKMPMEQPDCCALCPFIGIIPKEERPKGSKETRVCITTGEAMSERGSRVRKSQRDSHHPLRRPCDELWDAWYQAGGGYYGLKKEFYMRYRLPYNQCQQLTIKFHR